MYVGGVDDGALAVGAVPQAPPQRLQNRVSVGAFISWALFVFGRCCRFSIGPVGLVQVGSRAALRVFSRALAKPSSLSLSRCDCSSVHSSLAKLAVVTADVCV